MPRIRGNTQRVRRIRSFAAGVAHRHPSAVVRDAFSADASRAKPNRAILADAVPGTSGTNCRGNGDQPQYDGRRISGSDFDPNRETDCDIDAGPGRAPVRDPFSVLPLPLVRGPRRGQHRGN
jgi:hypothetical protein